MRSPPDAGGIRILVADDHVLIRRGLGQILSGEAGITIGAEVGTAVELIEQLRLQTFDLLILDPSIPGCSGLDSIREIRSGHPDVPILILNVCQDEHLALRALKAGALGYLTSKATPDEVVRAVRQSSSGGMYISAGMAERVMTELVTTAGRPAFELLSSREFDVMRLLARGKGQTEIAGLLYISVKTVATYRTRAMKKMHMTSTAELIRYAIRQGLVDG